MNLEEIIKIPPGEFKKYTKIKIKVLPTLESFYKHIARNMADLVKKNNKNDLQTKMIIPVGPTGQYSIFAEIVNKEKIDCKNLWTFNMDEYLDWQGFLIPESHPMSFRRCMKEIFWLKIDSELRIPQSQMYFPHPQKPEEINKKIDELGGVDVCYAGVGYHGHVAFNEAIISRWYKVSEEEFMNARTHIVSIADDTFIVNSIREAGGNCEIIPPFAVTLGMKDIMDSKNIIGVFFGGTWQRTVLRRTIFQEPTLEYPSTYLKKHPTFSILVDSNTAKVPEIAPD